MNEQTAKSYHHETWGAKLILLPSQHEELNVQFSKKFWKLKQMILVNGDLNFNGFKLSTSTEAPVMVLNKQVYIKLISLSFVLR